MKTTKLTILAAFGIGAMVVADKAYGHCDALDGPVVVAAKAALETGDMSPVLKWVNEEGEKEVREAFSMTMEARTQGAEARSVADKYFFETLVRVHRAGEGEPYTGLKPAGSIDPGFLAADNALSEGSVAELSADIGASVQDGLQERFMAVIEKQKHANESVEAGRAYVAAYVEYAHYVEALHALASRSAEEHSHLHAAK